MRKTFTSFTRDKRQKKRGKEYVTNSQLQDVSKCEIKKIISPSAPFDLKKCVDPLLLSEIFFFFAQIITDTIQPLPTPPAPPPLAI